MVIHITAYDLTNCTRSKPFVVSCGGLWSAFTPRLRQGPSSRYCPEIATVPAGSLRPASNPSQWYTPLTCGGSVLQMPTAEGQDKGGRVRPLAWHQACACFPCLGKRVPKRQATGPPHTPLPHPFHEPPDAMRYLFSIPTRNYKSASGALKTHVPPMGTVRASDLWRFCARRVSIPARLPLCSPWGPRALATHGLPINMCMPSTCLRSGQRTSAIVSALAQTTREPATLDSAAAVQPSGASPWRLSSCDSVHATGFGCPSTHHGPRPRL